MPVPAEHAAISATNLNLSYGLQTLLNEASLAINGRDKAGLVGRNGCGKSSFLKILAGLDKPDSGHISKAQGLVIGYLSQDFTLREDATVFENIRDGAADVIAMLEKFESGDASDHEMHILQDKIEAADGWDIDSRVKMFIEQLNAPAGERSLQGLSGGEKRRVALCRALVSQPDLLILDEPTNHLDTESILWLEEYLKNLRCAVIFVTHDRYFLDRVATRVIELATGKFFSHEGSYNDYLAAKAERQAQDQAMDAKRKKFLRNELEWVRAGVKARTTKSRHRMENYYKIADQESPEEELQMDLIIPPAPQLSNIIVDAEGVSCALGGKQLFNDLTLKFEPGTCTGIVGKNGLGKTTLLKILMGQMEADSGVVQIGKRTDFNYVDQTRLQLDPSKSVLDEVAGKTDFVRFGAIQISVRSYLKRFLFDDERINERIEILSGGEQNRVLLAKILREGGNFLILDEPTNDLDLQTLRVLEEAIISFEGCVLLVSHDRYFLDRVCDRIVAFEGDGRVTVQEGNYSYYLQKRAENARPKKVAEAPKPVKAVEKPKVEVKKLKWKEERELEEIEPKILAAEDRVAEIDTMFAAADFFINHGDKAQGLDDERNRLIKEIEVMYARWAELEAMKAAL